MLIDQFSMLIIFVQDQLYVFGNQNTNDGGEY